MKRNWNCQQVWSGLGLSYGDLDHASHQLATIMLSLVKVRRTALLPPHHPALQVFAVLTLAAAAPQFVPVAEITNSRTGEVNRLF